MTAADALLDWYAAGHRDLPWRRTRDPYAILVCEVMLQQTQVARVVAALRRRGSSAGRPPAALAAAGRADGPGGVGRPRLQPPRPAPVGGLPHRGAARLAGGPAHAARRRAVHRGGGRIVRIRTSMSWPSTSTCGASWSGSGAARAAAGPRRGVQPGRDGARRAGLHARVRRACGACPLAREVRLRVGAVVGRPALRRCPASASRTPTAGCAAAWSPRSRPARGCRTGIAPDRLERAVEGLLRDGLVVRDRHGLSLG